MTVADFHRMSHLAWEARDPQFDANLVVWAQDVVHRKVLVMRDPSWGDPDLTANQLGLLLSEDIARLGAGKAGETAKRQMAVMPDIEHVHSADYVMECYETFRGKRSGRGFYLTTEWHQTGWFSPELIKAINTDPLFFYLPQAYETGAAIPVDPRPVVQDCIDHWINPFKVQVFLSPKRLDIGWDGWAFDYINIPHP
jgi:hypothetical protein